jgi:replication factor C subunit 1
MDEVDGLGAGDRGGIGALIKIIKESKTPIICICNDRQDRKLMSLVNHCYDLRFQRPSID